MGILQIKHGLLQDLETYPGLNAELLWAQDAGQLYSTNVNGDKIRIGGSGSFVYKGAIDCSINPDYPAADCGHVYVVSVPGKIGGGDGLNVDNGDTLFCTADGSPAGDNATVGKDWNIIQYNVDILPTSKGGTGKAIMPAVGDLLVADTTSSFNSLAKGANGTVLTMVGGVVTWATHTHYDSWGWQVNSGQVYNVTSGKKIQHLNGSGIALTETLGLNGQELTVSLAYINANAILANATNRSDVPSSFAVNVNCVPGRLEGNIVNIPFGTSANNVAWGNHTHAQLHNQSHALVGSDHTLSGGTTGKVIRAINSSAFGWSAFTLPSGCSQGDILYASVGNGWSALTKSTTANSFLSNSGTNNNPSWRILAAGDLPANVAKYYVASYESGGSGITTMTITAATHGCGLKPMVQFVETNGVTDYRVATAEIIISQSTGDVTVNTDIAQKGLVIIIGS